jgi:Na+/H+-translocating membrane pyrophosphatase
LTVRILLKNNPWLFAAGLIGIAASYLFVWITQYYTEKVGRRVS